MRSNSDFTLKSNNPNTRVGKTMFRNIMFATRRRTKTDGDIVTLTSTRSSTAIPRRLSDRRDTIIEMNKQCQP